MNTVYKAPLRAAEAEFSEKKSRFIALITPVSNEQEALDFLRKTRKAHPEATHCVYAYRMKTNGICRHSDDGEPAGTAGMPLLDVFLKQEIYDFCCAAVRYFGGIKLGGGGLVRAYARCGAIALEAAGIATIREVALCSAVIPYSYYDQVRRLLAAGGANVTSEDFGIDVTLRFSVYPEEAEALRESVAEISSGAVTVLVEGYIMGAHV